MSTITQIRLWKDTGFTEGCLEVPKKGSSLPTPDFTYTGNYVPSTADIFSKLKLRVPYTTLLDCSYLAITLDMNNGTDRTFYGWIDNVSIISDTTSSALTQVDWHVDLWRTYISSAVIGSGMVRRRPMLTDDVIPPQEYPHRYFEVGTPIPFLSGNIWYLIFNRVSTVPSGTPETGITSYTVTSTNYFPVSKANPSARIDGAPSLNSIISGKWDEYLGMDPNTISSVFLSPIEPGTSGWQTVTTAKDYTYRTASQLNCIQETTFDLGTEAMTTDTVTYAVLGFDGEVVGTLPWGVPVRYFKIRTVIDSASAYLQIRCDDIKSHANGTCFTIPLIAVDLTSNAFSSYVYSGARQADIDQRVAETNKTLESNLAGVGTSAITGAVSGAQMAALGGPLGMLAGGLMGAISSSATQAMNTASTYAISSKYNDVFQDIQDYRAANQSNGLLMSGTGFDCLRYGQVPAVIRLSKDEYSVTQRNNDIAIYGAKVSEPRESCQELVDAGGPLQITNVVVRGSIPVQAKEYIRGRLSTGVRMI